MPDDLNELINKFALGGMEEKYDALRKLIASRKQHAAAKDERFQAGFDGLLHTAGDTSAQDRDRLLAVAVLGRLATSVKRLRKDIYPALAAPLREKLPDHFQLSEPDDRAHIASACEQAQPRWGAKYCCRAAIHEESEQARLAFLKALLTIKSDLDSSLEILAATALNFIPTTEDPGTSAVKRLKRLMTVLKITISEVMPEPGNEPGKRLARVCAAIFQDVPAPKQEQAMLEAAEELGLVIHEMVRLRFSLATEADTYCALLMMREMTTARVWEKFAVRSSSLRLVSRDITEAILILAKQGISDDALAAELNIAAGNKKRARQRLRKLAQLQGLAADVKNWLGKGKKEALPPPPRGESQQLDDDSRVAELLVESLRFQELENIGRQQILPEMETLVPHLGEGFTRLLQSGTFLCDTIQAMARRKGLRARGTPGDEEEYSPLEHELIDDDGTGVRRVSIIRPVVEQTRNNGVVFVISKGVVKKCK